MKTVFVVVSILICIILVCGCIQYVPNDQVPASTNPTLPTPNLTPKASPTPVPRQTLIKSPYDPLFKWIGV